MKILYDKVKEFAYGAYLPFAKISQSSQQENQESKDQFVVKNYDFIKLLWETLLTYLKSKDLVFLYALGVPDMFYINYTISMDIIETIKSLYIDE